jgi:hypothetical protein
MSGSRNLRRGHAPLGMRLRIDDLHAQLAPLDRYGVGGVGSAIAGGVWTFVRSFASGLRGALCGGLGGDRDCEAA